MADSQEVVGLRLDVDDKNLTEMTGKVEKAIKDMRSNVETELRALSENISKIPAEGIEALAGRVTALKEALNGATVDKNFVNAIKELNSAASAKDTTNLKDFAAAFSQMVQAMNAGGTGAAIPTDTAATLKGIGDAAGNTTLQISSLVQQIGEIAGNVQNASVAMNEFVEKLQEAKSASSGKQNNAGGFLIGKVQESQTEIETYKTALDGLYKKTEDIMKKLSSMGGATNGVSIIPEQAVTQASELIDNLKRQVTDLENKFLESGKKGGAGSDNMFTAYMAAINQLKGEIENLYKYSDGVDNLSKTFSNLEAMQQRLHAAQNEFNAAVANNQAIDKAQAQLDAYKESLKNISIAYEQYKAQSLSATNPGERDRYSQLAENSAKEAVYIQRQIELLQQSAVEEGKLNQKREAADAKQQERLQKQVQSFEDAHARMMSAANKEYNSLIANEQKAYELKQKEIEATFNSNESQVLKEQNQLLYERMRLLRTVSSLDIELQKNSILGQQSLSADRLGLKEDTIARIKQVDEALAQLKTTYATLTPEAQKAFDTRNAEGYAAWQKQLIEYEEQLAKAKQKAREQAKAPTSEELYIQKQLAAIYSDKLRYENQLLQVQNKVTAQGGVATAGQQQWINHLNEQIAKTQELARTTAQITDSNGNVERTYKAIARAAAENHAAELLKAQEKAAYELSTALEKVRNTTQKGVIDSSSINARIEAVQAKLTSMNAEMQRLLNEKHEIRLTINSQTQADVAQLNEQIRALYTQMYKAMSASNGNNYDIFKAYQPAIEQLKAQLADIAKQRETALTGSSEAQDSAIKTLLAEYDQLYEKLGRYQNAVGKAEEINAQIFAHNEKVEQYKASIEALSTSFEKLKAQNKAYNDDNTLTRAGESIQKQIAALQEELKLMTATADEAKRMSDAVKSKSVEEHKQRVEELRKEYSKLAEENENLRTLLNAAYPSYGNMTEEQEAAYHKLEQRWSETQTRMTEIARSEVGIRTEYEREAQQKLEQEKLANAKQTISQIVQEQAALQKMVTYDDAIKNAESARSYNERAQAIKDCKSALQRLDETQEDGKMQADNLRKAVQDLTKAQKDYETALKGASSFASAQQALQIASQTKTLHNLEAAYKELQAAMKNTRVDSSQWSVMNQQLKTTKEQLDGIKKKMSEFKEETTKINGVAGQLRNQMAAIFSVTAIQGFIKKIVEVRAQFELQRIALGAILQDTEKANEVFKQVQSMALESPFSIMQLEKATKQIAAFGVEADKLKPSIKMLADISAGLGVDIDRLILVYGHIKANNALQQLHVRQFTNAGFNIAGELAKYYTEMEGKLVSVAEVTDRIHKKLVSFADVEEVLKRVTSAGGMFYDMQKKQSDSLWGQMQRIKDQYDLMMNEIGQSNQGAISWALTTIRSLIKEWRDLAPVITAAAAAFGSYLVVGKMLPMIIGYLKSVVVSYKSLTAAAMGATAAQEGLNAAQKANAVGLIVSAVTMLVTYLWQAAHATDALADELNRIYTEGTTTMWNLAHNFEELAQQATSHTNTYEDRKKALDDINRIYGDILPKEAIQIENLEKSRDKWGELTEAVKTYELERMKQLAQQSINAELQKQMEEIKVDLMATAGDFIKFNKSIKDTEKGVKTTINTIFTGIEAEILSGSLKAEDATAAFIQRMKKYYNLSDEVQLVMPNVTEWRSAFGDTLAAMGQTLAVWQDDYGKKFKKSWQKMWYDVRNSSTWGATTFDIVSINTMDKLNQVADLYSDMEERYGMFNDALANADTYTARQLAQNSQKYVNAFKDRMSVVDNYMKVVEGFQDTDRVAALTNGDGSLTELGKALESVNEILKRLGKAPLTIESINEALASNIGLQQHFQDVSTEVLGGFLAWLKTTNDYAQNDYLQGWAKRAQKQVSELGGTEIQRNVQAVMNQIASSLGVSLEIFDEVKVTGQDTFDTIRKSVQGLITKYQELGKEWDKIAGTMVLADPTAQAEKVTGMTKEQRENLETFIKALQMLFSGLGGLDKESNKSGKDEVLEMWKKRIKYIEDFFKQYKEGLKNFSKESVDEQVTKNFSQLFSQTGIDKLQGLNIADLIAGNVDDKGLVAAFERLKALIPAQYKDLMDEVQKKISDTSMSIDVEVQKQGVEDFKKELQDMFDNYELSKTFKDLGIDINFTTMVGGTPTTLEDLKSSIDDTWKQVLVNQKLYGSEGEKAWKDYQKKLTDIENKEQQERIKNYAKYLTQAYGERASYELDALADIQKMRTDILKIKDEAQKKISSADTTEEEKERLSKIIKQWDNELAQGISNMKEEMEKKLTEFDFKALTESPLFSEMFQDLSSLSNKVLDQMIVKIKEIRENTSNLSLTQIRTLAQYEEKLANAKFDASAFKAPIEAIQKAYKLRAEGITAQSASDDLAAAQQKLDLYQQELNDLQLVQGILDGNRNINKEDLVLTENQNKLLKMEPSLISAKLAATKANVKASEGEVSDLIEYVNTYKQAQSATQKLSATLQEVGKVGGEAIDAITSGIKLFGGEVDDSTQIWLDFAKQVIDQCVTLGIAFVALGIEINKALGIIGLIASALSVVVGLFTALLGAHDAKLSKQIKKLENNVKDLEAAFDKLEKARDKALTVESYDTDYEAMEANLKKQIQDYQQMIELESRKKDADEDTLRDYRDTISDLQDQLEELKETRITDLGGFGESNYRDVAEDFVDAWLDAFKEAGDGLDALDDKWQEYMENLFLKQAAMKKAGTLYSKAMSIIDNAIDSGQSGFELEQAVQLARQAADDASTELNEYLKALAGVFGISQEGENTLSELQQGISNITESQAAAIEAYLNSIRFFVASQDTRLANIYTIIYDQYVGSSNPLVSVVTEIRDALNQFASRFASAFVNSGGKWKLQVC